MALFRDKGYVTVQCTFTCNEKELRALDGLSGYGDDAFIKHFYEKLGKAYMESHEAGLREFLQTIRDNVPTVLHGIDEARRLLARDAKERHEKMLRERNNKTEGEA